jgi:hypothetical protein
MRTAITHNLYEVDGAVSATDFASGPKLPLGTLAGFGPSDADVELYYVKAGAAAATDGNVVGEGDPQYEPAASDEAVVSFGGTGPSTWVYVKAASALRRGQAVIPTAVATPREVEAAGVAVGSERVVGVAQHNIAAGSWGWILRSGAGVVACDGTVVAGSGLLLAGVAGTVTPATVGDATIGYALEDDGATYDSVASVPIAKAILDCKG